MPDLESNTDDDTDEDVPDLENLQQGRYSHCDLIDDQLDQEDDPRSLQHQIRDGLALDAIRQAEIEYRRYAWRRGSNMTAG